MSLELMSLVALIVALAATISSYALLRLKRYPMVVLYAERDRKRSAVINLVLANKGKDAAHDVKFLCNKKIPSRAFGLEDAPKPGYMTDGPLVDGIRFFGAGKKIVITWGQYGGLKRGLGEDLVEFTAIYHGWLPLRMGRRKWEKVSRVDLRPYKGALGRKPRKKVPETMQEIELKPHPSCWQG